MEETKKSKVWIYIIVFLLLLILIGGVVLFFGYKALSSAIEPKDLGVSYTYEDYEGLIQEIGIDVEAEKLCLDCPALEFSNPNEIDVTVSGAQASAAFDIVNEHLSTGSVSNTQIRFNDGYGEMSTVFTYQGRSYPVYISGAIEKANEKAVDGYIRDIKVGNLNVPSALKNYVEEGLINLANERMETMGDNFRIDEVAITSNGIEFEGLVPTKAE